MSLFATASHFTIIAPTAPRTVLEITVGLLMGYGSLCFIDRVKKEGEKFNHFSLNLYKTATAYNETPTPSPGQSAWSALGGFFLQMFY